MKKTTLYFPKIIGTVIFLFISFLSYGQTQTFTTYIIPLAKQTLSPELYNYFTEIKEDFKHRLWAVSVMGIYLIDEKNKKLVQKYNSDDIGITTSLNEATNGETYFGQFKKWQVKINKTKKSIEV